MHKKISIIFFVLLFSNYLLSQQMPLLTQYENYNGYLNPATLNIDYFTQQRSYYSGGILYRNQWAVSTFGVNTTMMRFEYFSQIENCFCGWLGGAFLAIDNIGASRDMAALFRTALYLGDLDERFIGLGFSYNIANHTTDYTTFISYEVEAEYVPLKLSANYYDVGVGVWGAWNLIQNDMYIYGGLSFPQLLGYSKEFEFQNPTYNYKRIQHIYGQLGLFYTWENSNYSKVNLSYKKVPILPAYMDFNFNYTWTNEFKESLFDLGLGYTSIKATHARIGFYFGANKQYKLSLFAELPLATYGRSIGHSWGVDGSILKFIN